MNLAWRFVAVAVYVTSLSACAVLYDPKGVFNNITSGGQAGTAESALAAYQKGDYPRAESLAKDVLRINPKDPYALMALAETYQDTGRPDLARQYFTSLVSLNPQAAMVQGGVSKTIAQVARDHLAVLNAPYEPVKPPPEVTAAEMGVASDAAVVARFQTLRQLLDQGLITNDEYIQRRGANLGALLPYTAPPSSMAMTRPSPAPDEVINRLNTLSNLYKNHEITADSLAVERNFILDRLMPANAVERAPPPPPVTDDMAVAAIIGRLQRLRDARVITEREATRERSTVEQQLALYKAQAEAAARAAAGMNGGSMSPAGQGVHLASYSNQKQAETAWASLQKRFPDQLGSLKPSIKRIVLRHGRVYYRLSAGPLADRKAASAVCRALSRRHQFCEPILIK